MLPQMIKPPRTTELSVNHVAVDPAAIGTLAGPLEPLYRVLPILM